MKKLALLLVATVMISGGAFAQDKTTSKTSTTCTHSCSKKGCCKKGTAKTSTATATPAKQTAPQKAN